jgi:hypothetical protein
MIKSITIVLGGLFLISTTYFLSFWERFDIDVFQYMQITDIIKGALYPMRIVGLWYLAILLFVIISLSLALSNPRSSNVNIEKPNAKLGSAKEENQNNFLHDAIRLLLVVILTLSIIGYFYVSVKGLKDSLLYIIEIAVFSAAYTFISVFTYRRLYIEPDKQIRGVDKRKGVHIFGIRLVNIFSHEEHEEKDTENKYDMITDYLAIPTFAYLMICALFLGRLDSEKVDKCVEYNYVKNLIIKTEVGDTTFSKLIYLGTISDKVIFLNKKNSTQSHLVISKDKLPAMEVFHYNKIETNCERK